MVEVYESFEVEAEFIQHIYSSARRVMEEDKADIEAFENGPLLNKLINRGDTFATLKMEVVRLSKMMREVDKLRYKFLDKIKKRTITGVEYDKKLDELDEAYHMFRSQYEHMFSRYKLESERGLQRRRTRMRQCVQSKYLYTAEPVDNPELNYGTITQCTFLIEEYCRWHNDRVRGAVKLEKREEKAAKKRESRAIKKATTPQFKQKQERIEIITPLLDEGMNPNQISAATNIPKSTVQRLVKEINAS